MQTLRKKNSPCKFKNDPTRFLGEGVSFKAKLIGILEVSEARGDRMCQAALADLKMAIRAAGEHKQRIAVQVSIDGLRLRDEKTGDCLYHHPVHKISFIAQDMSDSRAFGYIFGSPDTGHRFFGIKTDKAASQVVIAMRDLFQVVFELKKKEIELAKQHIEQNAINAIKFHTGGIFVEPAPDTKGAASTESSFHRIRTTNSEVDKSADRKNESQSGVIADLLDLQFELNSLQQGIHQMDKITPENPVPSTDDLFESDPFGDSFANMKLQDTVRPILPPPPSSTKRGHLERQHTVPVPPVSTTSSPATTLVSKTPPPQSTIHWFDKETENLFNDSELTNLNKNSTTKKEEDSSTETTPRNTQTKSPQIDVFTELDPLGTGLIKPYVDKKDFFQHLKNPPKKVLKDLVSTNSSDCFPTNFNVTTAADSLESTKQNELSSKDNENSNFANFDQFDKNEANQSSQQRIDSPPKKETVARSIHHQPLSVSLPPEETTSSKGTITSTTTSGGSSILRSMDRDSTESTQALVKLPSPKKYLQRKRDFDIDLPAGKTQSVESSKPFPVDFSVTNESPASPLRSCSSDANSRLSSSSAELDLVPEPPPRGAGSILINPPPLPPKKQSVRGGVRPPPRPPHTDGHFQYDFPPRETSSPSPTRIIRDKNKSPPKDTKGHQFDDNFSPPPQMPARSNFMATTTTTSAFEDSFSTIPIPSTTPSASFTGNITVSVMDSKKPKPSLDITLSQLTSSWTNLDELASSLGMTVQQLTSLTLTQLTQCLANLSTKETVAEDEVEETMDPSITMEEQPVIPSKPTISSLSSLASKSIETTGPNSTSFTSSELFKSNNESEPKQDSTYDKYAVFRELLEMEQIEQKEETNVEEITEMEKESNESGQIDGEKIQPEVRASESTSNSITSLTNLTAQLSSKSENLLKEKLDETMINSFTNLTEQKEKLGETEDIEKKDIEKESEIMADADITSDSSTVQQTEIDAEDDTEKTQTIMDVEEKADNSEKGSDANGTSSDKVGSDILNDETNGSSVAEKSEVKSSTSTSSDRYAALREIIGEPEPSPIRKDDEEMISSARTSPAIQSQQPKSLAEIELLNLFSDNLPPPSSPNISAKKDPIDLKTVAMDIFEEIKMLNTGMHRAKETKPAPPSSSGFEDMFCPFSETTRSDKDDGKEDGNWAKFDTGIFGSSDRSSCEGQRSIGGTSPWSPDGKDFHREVPFKGSGGYRHSGDSDNEWKDEEESEESNGRGRGDGRFWSGSRHPRFDAPGFEDRSFYEDGEKRDRSFRERMGRKSRGALWTKSSGSHRPRDPSPWHDEGQWEDEGPRRYRKVQSYKDDEDQYEVHWKCRPKPPPQRCNWSHDVHGTYYDDERKRKLMLWNDEDRFGSEESMGYDEEDRWSRRRYERRRWEEDSRFWSRRGPPDADYPMREAYYYYRESRERPHDYPSWEEEYGSERPGDDSPRYNPANRKRHWPKRPNSANDGRNSDMLYPDSRKFGGASRSECSDNDSDPYLRSSQRSRSRESYWGSDQEYDSWVERPYWSEGPDTKSETMHRKRIARHKTRQTQKTQSPFEDDFAQSVEHAEPSVTGPGVAESLTPMEARVRLEMTEQKREPPQSVSPSSGIRGSKDHPRRDMSVREYGKRSSYFEDDLTPTASASSDASDRPRLSSDFKATPEELPCDAKDLQQPVDGFVSEESGRDSFFNGDLRFDDDAFVFKSELDDNVPDHRATTLPLKNSRQGKYGPGNNNNNNKAARSDQYIRKSESVNIFARESDPFDDDDFFN
ncbi:protein disabled isoform X1 [Cataglyphis hispanica]|uniref:protein disabled isoform X1 n=1 Tax=Cataglyphis hispanica TaxID=1086592 RepID=UPI00217FE1C0|nr:protein disabled isoform X1 [Cataglyphis hispanica]